MVARHRDARGLAAPHNFSPATSAAAPGIAQEARTRPVTNHTAPVDAGSCAAVETAGERHSNHNEPGGPVSGAGVAGMAGSVGAGRSGGT